MRTHLGGVPGSTAQALIACLALVVSPGLQAQTAAADEQTPDDLICGLAGSCVATAGTEESAETETTPPVTDDRVSPTRGFKVSRKTSAPSSTAPARARMPARAKFGSAAVNASKASSLGRADLRLTFLSGSAVLTDDGLGEATKFAKALESPLLSGMRFRIEGHTDAVGSRSANQDLSLRRAEAVIDYLASLGLDRARFEAVGYGSDRPLPRTSATSASNRRVEVVRISTNAP